ncbi:MAG: hypothetical protein HUJ52_04350, partial [Malacoplasma sp.]|nr:hypothetical protein [Malacoplasma sp.]
VKDKQLFPIIKGLYETDPKVSNCYLASAICGPSYLSFDFALAYHGLILEMVHGCTSATYCKNKTKEFETPFGYFVYHDVPKEAFPYGIKFVREGGYAFCIASPEKALCDKLYTLDPISNVNELNEVLLEDLRVPDYMLFKLKKKDISFLAKKYRCRNIYLLDELLRRYYNG